MTSVRPGSPLKATPDTGSEWPGMNLMGRPCCTSHKINTSSKPPLTCRRGSSQGRRVAKVCEAWSAADAARRGRRELAATLRVLTKGGEPWPPPNKHLHHAQPTKTTGTTRTHQHVGAGAECAADDVVGVGLQNAHAGAGVAVPHPERGVVRGGGQVVTIGAPCHVCM